MATKIRRALFIGLGGTGMKTLLHTKKMFIDTYGEVPPMIGFLGIDTDSGEYSKTLYSNRGEEIRLLPNEQLPIHVDNAKPYYQRNRAAFSWIPDENVGSLTSMKLGAGQVRTNGRFAYTINHQDVIDKIQHKLNDITNARIVTNAKYELLTTAPPEIHMVFSICGGTGSGTFISMAATIKNNVPNSKLVGYAVLPDVFKSMSTTGMAKVGSNAYGAIMDLDYLMHQDMNKRPVTITYLNDKDTETIAERPFNAIVFIDNKNANNDSYNDVEQLSQMISLSLITATGELSVAGASTGDNLEKNIREGSMDIENKRAWAGGMGACEIVYRGNILSEIYQIKAAKNIIDRLLGVGDDANIIANAWIDSNEVHIRENNGVDHVTDYIANKTPQYSLFINNEKEPRPEVDANIASNKINQEEIDRKVEELLTRSRSELRKLIVNHINRSGGITTSLDIITELKSQIAICLREMQEEKENLSTTLPQHVNKIDIIIDDIKKCNFLQGSKKKSLCADLVLAVNQYCADLRDIQRHDAAINFYNSITVNFNEIEDKITLIKNNLENIKANLTNKVNRLQQNIDNGENIFQCNLAANDARRITVGKDDINFTDFFQTLEGEHKIYGWGEYSSQEIEGFFIHYTSTLPQATQYQKKSVEDILRQIQEQNSDEFDRILRIAINKSMPLFRYDHDGYTPLENPSDIYYVGTYDANNNFLKENDLFKSKISGTPDVSFASTGMKDKIIIYRQLGVVPAYTIYGLNRLKGEYNDCSVSCNIDEDLKRRMERENFEINPTPQENNDMLDLWVKGFVYGLIKNESKSYYMKSTSLGDALEDYWIKLAEWRDEAFEEFKRNEKAVVKDFNAYIGTYNANKGADSIQELLSDAKENYWENYSQIKIARETLKSRGYEKVADLLRQEIVRSKKLSI